MVVKPPLWDETTRDYGVPSELDGTKIGEEYLRSTAQRTKPVLSPLEEEEERETQICCP